MSCSWSSAWLSLVLLACACATSDQRGRDSGPGDGDAGVDGGADGDSDADVPDDPPQVHFVEPSRGPVEGGTAVVITGLRFAEGALARFGGAEVACDRVRDTSLSCRTPAHEAGLVDVEVENPGGGVGRFPGGFEYTDAPPVVTQAVLVWPPETTAYAGRASETIYARVTVPGLTDGPAPADGVVAEIGWGADAGATDAFTWSATELVGEVGAADEYGATITIAVAGTYAYAMRFSADGGESWSIADLDGLPYSADKAGSILVEELPAGLFVESVEPSWGAVAGGTSVTIRGQAMQAGATVTIGGAAAGDVVVAADGLSLTATVPAASAAGRADVIVHNPDDTVGALGDAWEYVLYGSPVVDGALGEDWPAAHLLAENDTVTDWGEGLNEMRALWVAWDEDALTLGIDGLCESDNAIVFYLDPDYGAGSGLSDATTIGDGDGALDIALGGRVAVADPAFGADWGGGTKGMASVTADALSGDAGLRLLANAQDLGWFPAAVATGPAVEVSIPMSTLLPEGVPGSGATLAVFARLVNRDGEHLSNQTLPLDDPVAPEDVSLVATFRVR
jgi:hypothetical protein